MYSQEQILDIFRSYKDKLYYKDMDEKHGHKKEFTINPTYMLKLWNFQKGLDIWEGNHIDIDKISLDRIDNSKGHIITNVMFVHGFHNKHRGTSMWRSYYDKIISKFSFKRDIDEIENIIKKIEEDNIYE